MTTPITYLVHVSKTRVPIQEEPIRTIVSVMSVEDLRNHCLEHGIVDPYFRLKKSPQEIPKLPDEALKSLHALLLSPIDASPDTHITHDRLILYLIGTLKQFSCAFMLRGSKAAELINPLFLFCSLQGLSDSELKRNSAHDTDWYCRLDQIPDRFQTPAIKNAILEALPKETTHLHITVPEHSNLVKTTPAAVLASVGIRQKTDFIIGNLSSPYLFLRDAFSLHIDGSIDPTPYFWQAITDHALGIVRLEKRHELDFYSFLAAMEQKIKGCLIIEEGTTLQNILNSFPDLTSYELDRAIKKRIRDHRMDPLSFLMQVLEEIAKEHPELAEDVWRNCLPFIKDLSQERHHPLSIELLRYSHTISFQEMHATLEKCPQELRTLYPFIPQYSFASASPHPRILQIATSKVLLMRLREYRPNPLHPYPAHVLLTLIDFFIEGKLLTSDKIELQRHLNISSQYELVPIELFKELLKTPDRLKPFSIDPMTIFHKCSVDLQIELLNIPNWQIYFVLKLSPDELLKIVSKYSFKLIIPLINIPIYASHLEKHLESLFTMLLSKIKQINPPLQNLLFTAYFQYIVAHPEKGLEILSRPSFQELMHYKGFQSALPPRSKELLMLSADTPAFIPLLKAHQDGSIAIPIEIATLRMPLDHAIELCLASPIEMIEILSHVYCYPHELGDFQAVRLLNLFCKHPFLLDRLSISSITLTSLRLSTATLLLHTPGRESEAIQLAINAIQLINVVPPALFYTFAEDLLDKLAEHPYPDAAPIADVINLINVHFRACEMAERKTIAKRMQRSNHSQIKACGLLWSLRIVEACSYPYDVEELIGLFDGLSSLAEPQRTLFRKDLSDCKLLSQPWDDVRLVDRIFTLFNDEFNGHLKNKEFQKAFQTYVRYMNLQGRGFLMFPVITKQLMEILLLACAQMYLKEEFVNFLNMLYLTLSGFQLNGLAFPNNYDPCDLYFQMRSLSGADTCVQQDRFSMKFLSSLFKLCKRHIGTNPKRATFCFQIYYRFLKEYLKRYPTQEAQGLYYQYLNWLLIENQIIGGDSVHTSANKLIVLGNTANYFTPASLTLYQLLALQEPTTNAKDEVDILNHLTILNLIDAPQFEGKYLRIVSLAHFLIKNGSDLAKKLATTFLYDQINHLVVLPKTNSSLSIELMFKKIKDSIDCLVRQGHRIPRQVLGAFKQITIPPMKL